MKRGLQGGEGAGEKKEVWGGGKNEGPKNLKLKSLHKPLGTE